jgi:hypothetical protein
MAFGLVNAPEGVALGPVTAGQMSMRKNCSPMAAETVCLLLAVHGRVRTRRSFAAGSRQSARSCHHGHGEDEAPGEKCPAATEMRTQQ